MPSSLTGLIRALVWTDFPPRRANAPGPGQTATAANTSVAFSVTGVAVQPIPGARPAQFRLADNITVRVTFDRNQKLRYELALRPFPTVSNRHA